jgi:hypothetical protein
VTVLSFVYCPFWRERVSVTVSPRRFVRVTVVCALANVAKTSNTPKVRAAYFALRLIGVLLFGFFSPIQPHSPEQLSPDLSRFVSVCVARVWTGLHATDGFEARPVDKSRQKQSFKIRLLEEAGIEVTT